jgi:hypothetical protein
MGELTPPADVADLDVRVDCIDQTGQIRRLHQSSSAHLLGTHERAKRTTVTASVTAARQLTPYVYL